MALRIPKLLRDLLDTPPPEEGKVLRWGPAGRLENAVLPGSTSSSRSTALAALGIWIGATPPPTPISYDSWVSGASGYWAWIDTSSTAAAPLLLSAPASQMSFSGATPAQLTQPTFITRSAPAADLLLQGIIPTLRLAGTSIIYAPAANIGISGGVPVLFVSGGLISLTSVGAGLSLASGVPSLGISNWKISLTSAAANLAVTAVVPTTAISGGGAASASDSFSRSYADWSSTTAYAVDDRVVYSAALYRCVQAHTNQSPVTALSVPNAYWVGDPGPDWTAPSWAHLFGVSQLLANATATSCAPGTGAISAGYYNATSFASNHKSDVTPSSGNARVAVRIQAAGCYSADTTPFDEEGFPGIDYVIRYFDGVTETVLWSAHTYDAPTPTTSVVLEANGSTITLKVDGATINSVTHSTLTGGAPGIYFKDFSPPNPMASAWSGADL